MYKYTLFSVNICAHLHIDYSPKTVYNIDKLEKAKAKFAEYVKIERRYYIEKG